MFTATFTQSQLEAYLATGRTANLTDVDAFAAAVTANGANSATFEDIGYDPTQESLLSTGVANFVSIPGTGSPTVLFDCGNGQSINLNAIPTINTVVLAAINPSDTPDPISTTMTFTGSQNVAYYGYDARTAPRPTIDPICRALGIALPPVFRELPPIAIQP